MKKLLNIFIAALVAVALTACGTVATPISTGTAPVKSPQQIAAQICPDLTVTLSSLQALILPPNVTADLNSASFAVSLVCGVGATVNLASLQTVLATGLPALVSAIKASGMSTAAQNNAILLVSAAQIIVSGILAANTPIPVAAPAPASAASK